MRSLIIYLITSFKDIIDKANEIEVTKEMQDEMQKFYDQCPRHII